jgi:hypothetical protein
MREATHSDLPKGREAQCPICWRLFRSDHACEAHKPYRRPVGPQCKEPAGLGMVALERRSLAVWGTPMTEGALEALKSQRVERSDESEAG